MLLDQHQAFVVYLNLLLSSYSIFWNKYNPTNNRLWNHVLDQLQAFECFHMFSYRFQLTDQLIKKVFFHQSWYCNVLFLQMEENILCVIFGVHYFQMIKQKVYLLPVNFAQINNLNIGYLVQLVLRLNPDFNFCNSFALSLVDNVTTLERKVLYQLLQILSLDLQQYEMV